MPKLLLDETKPWQRGIPLAYLKRVRECFRQFDEGHCFGAFAPFKENSIADYAAGDQLLVLEDGGAVVAAAAVVRVAGKKTINGFAGPLGSPVVGAVQVKRMACLPGCEGLLAELVAAYAGEDELWLEGWVESGQVLEVCELLGAARVGSKVMAASEIVGVFARDPAVVYPQDPHEDITLQKTRLTVKPQTIASAVAEIADSGVAFSQHYSGYNRGASWSALALRGFGGRADFIIKPEEMSRKWKAEHPDEMGWECGETLLWDALPTVVRIADAVPGEKERVRLMRLAPGGGELLRHADVTDPDAGIAEGRLLRIHVPLVTNPQVEFTQWLLSGEKKTVHMAAGEVWYLDTRKPHTAVNNGSTERIHLVLDVKSNAKLRSLLCRD